jgi:hypothetical protein
VKSTKIVVRYTDGRVKKGYTQNFFPSKPIFHLSKNLNKESGEVERIRLGDLKGIFFVKSFAGDPDYEEEKALVGQVRPIGRNVEVTFLDGEVIGGSALSYNPTDFGFFLFPPDPKNNNSKIFVVNKAVKDCKYVQQRSWGSPAKGDYQMLAPEFGDKVIILNDEEKNLMKLVLARVIESESGKSYIIKKLGRRYLRIGTQFLKEMEGADAAC